MGDQIIVVSMTAEERDAIRRLPMAVTLLERQAMQLIPSSAFLKPTQGEEIWMTAEEVRVLCRCHIGRVRRAIVTGALPSTARSRGKGGRQICYVKKDDAMDWMEHGRPESK